MKKQARNKKGERWNSIHVEKGIVSVVKENGQYKLQKYFADCRGTDPRRSSENQTSNLYNSQHQHSLTQHIWYKSGFKASNQFWFLSNGNRMTSKPHPSIIPEPVRYFWSLCSFSINSPSGLLFKTQTVYNPTSWDAWEKSYCVAFPASHNNSFIILISILLHSRGQLTMEWMATTIWFKQTLVLWKTCITLAEPIIKWQLHSRWDWSTLSSHTVEQLLWKQIMEEQQHR